MSHRRRTSVLWFMLVCSSMLIDIGQCSTSSKRRELLQFLFDDYDAAAMSSGSYDTPVTVGVNLTLWRIADVDDQKQTVTIAAYVSMAWHDSSLCWNPEDHSNISDLVVSAEKIWRPELYITSLADRLFQIDNLPVYLYSWNVQKCLVVYVPSGIWTFSCDFDTTKFPFDVQVCWINVGKYFSMASSMRLVNGTDKVLFMEDAEHSNGLWDIVETKSELDPLMGKVMFMLKLQRKSGYYVMYIIIPLLIMATLNVMVFCLPADSGEKISLSITTLLAFTIVLITLQGMTPPSADSMPILTGCTVGLMMISTLGVVVTVIVVKIDKYDDDQEIPRWLMSLTDCSRRRRRTITDGVQVISSTETTEKCTRSTKWREVAAGIDRIAFCSFLSGEAVFLLVSGIRMKSWKETHVQPSW